MIGVLFDKYEGQILIDKALSDYYDIVTIKLYRKDIPLYYNRAFNSSFISDILLSVAINSVRFSKEYKGDKYSLILTSYIIFPDYSILFI